MNTNDLEKDNLTGKNHENPNVNRPLKVLTATSIIGDKVENTEGEKVGKIKDLMIDLSSGKIDYVVLEVGGFLGINDKLFAIPFSAFKPNPHNQDFKLDVKKDFLEKAPGFDPNHWPETNNHEFDSHTAYWGNFMGPSVGNRI